MPTSNFTEDQDDLIIIDDGDNLLDESISESKKVDNESELINLEDNTSTEMIDFNSFSDDEKSVDKKDEIVLGDKSDDEISFSFGDDIEAEDKKNEEETILNEENINNNDFSLDLDQEKTDIQEITPINTIEVFDLDSATELFIAQLNKRKIQIADFIKKDETSIVDLEEQIKKLQEKVKEHNTNIKSLNDENTKIDDRILILTGTIKKSTATEK